MLTLRDLQTEDESWLIQYLNNPEVVKYLTDRIPFPYTRDDARWWITSGSKKEIVRAIVFAGVPVGVIGVCPGIDNYRHKGEIGYWLGEDFWGQGIATQAVITMTDYIFNNTSLQKLFAPVFAENIASAKALEKAGYQLEGVFRQGIIKDDNYYDERVYSLIKST